VHRRLLDHLTDFAQRADVGMVSQARSRTWMRHLDAEVDNMKAITDWAVSHGDIAAAAKVTASIWLYWWIRGHTSWMEDLLRRVTAAGGDDLEGEAQLQVSWLHSGVHFMAGRFDEAIPHLRAGIEGARAGGDTDILAWGLAALGACLTHDQDYTEAQGVLTEAAALFEQMGSPLGVGYAQTHLGDIRLLGGDPAGALRIHTECLDAALAADHDHLAGQALCHLGFDLLVAGDLTGARERFAQAGDRFRVVRHVEGATYCMAGLAGVAHRLERHEAAARILGAITATRAALGLGAWPLMAQLEAMIAADVRDSIGPQTFDLATAAGAALPAGDALDYALEVTGPADVTAATTSPAATVR